MTFCGIQFLSNNYIGYTVHCQSWSLDKMSHERQKIIEMVDKADAEELRESNSNFLSSSTIAQPFSRFPCNQLPQNTE
jgi:hypothetical protein